MSRPKAPGEQRARAYAWWGVWGSKPKAIHTQLELEFSKAVSLRTVNTWLTEFKTLPQTDSQDMPFEWGSMANAQIPLDGGPYVKNLLAWRREIADQFDLELPTVREVKWSWRVRQAAQDLRMWDVLVLAIEFANREIRREVLGESVNDGDLSAYLAYAPWRGEVETREYSAAVAAGHIDAVLTGEARYAHVERITQLALQKKFQVGFLSALVAHAATDGVAEEPGRKPSERLMLLLLRNIDKEWGDPEWVSKITTSLEGPDLERSYAKQAGLGDRNSEVLR